MKRRHILLAGIVTLSFAVAGGLAQQKTDKPETARFGNPTSTARALQDYIYGVVKQVEKTELVLDKTASGVDEVFKLEPKTKIIRDGKPSTLDDLKIGDQVFVQVKKDKKTGDKLAKKVVTGVPPT